MSWRNPLTSLAPCATCSGNTGATPDIPRFGDPNGAAAAVQARKCHGRPTACWPNSPVPYETRRRPRQRAAPRDIMPDAGLMRGKRGLIMGLANNRSLAWGIAKAAHAHGAELAFTYQIGRASCRERAQRSAAECAVKRERS